MNEQPLALCTSPSVAGSLTSDNIDPGQRKGDVLVNLNNFLVTYLLTQKILKWNSGKNCLRSKSNLQIIIINFI